MSEPVKIASGKFAIYQTDRGGMHLALHVEGELEPRHMDFPPLMVKMIMRKAGSNGFGSEEIPSTLTVVESGVEIDAVSGEPTDG